EAQCAEVASACRAEGQAAAAAGDHGAALALYHGGCAGEDSPACAAMLETLAAHPEVRASAPRIGTTLRTRCEAGEDPACAQLGRDAFDGADRASRSAPVLRALVTACEREVGPACAGRGAITEAQRRRQWQANSRADFI